MKRKLVTLCLFRGVDDGKTYIQDDYAGFVDRPDLYPTFGRIIGKTAIVTVFSHEEFSQDECKRAAIKYMTGQFSRWTMSLAEDEPKWRRVK